MHRKMLFVFLTTAGGGKKKTRRKTTNKIFLYFSRSNKSSILPANKHQHTHTHTHMILSFSLTSLCDVLNGFSIKGCWWVWKSQKSIFLSKLFLFNEKHLLLFAFSLAFLDWRAQCASCCDIHILRSINIWIYMFICYMFYIFKKIFNFLPPTQNHWIFISFAIHLRIC